MNIFFTSIVAIKDSESEETVTACFNQIMDFQGVIVRDKNEVESRVPDVYTKDGDTYYVCTSTVCEAFKIRSERHTLLDGIFIKMFLLPQDVDKIEHRKQVLEEEGFVYIGKRTEPLKYIYKD